MIEEIPAVQTEDKYRAIGQRARRDTSKLACFLASAHHQASAIQRLAPAGGYEIFRQVNGGWRWPRNQRLFFFFSFSSAEQAYLCAPFSFVWLASMIQGAPVPRHRESPAMTSTSKTSIDTRMLLYNIYGRSGSCERDCRPARRGGQHQRQRFNSVPRVCTRAPVMETNFLAQGGRTQTWWRRVCAVSSV